MRRHVGETCRTWCSSCSQPAYGSVRRSPRSGRRSTSRPGRVQITSTLVRVKGEGLLRKGTKSRAGERTLPLPETAVAMLRRRFMTGARLDQPLFPDVLGGFRDPANVRRELRDARGTEALAWITSHSFRKTAATILDEAALSARLVADQLGHSRPSMTQDVYMGRRAVDSQAAVALEAALRDLASAGENNGKTMSKDEGQTRVMASDLRVCAPSGTRTPNPLIKSQLLCQLS